MSLISSFCKGDRIQFVCVCTYVQGLVRSAATRFYAGFRKYSQVEFLYSSYVCFRASIMIQVTILRMKGCILYRLLRSLVFMSRCETSSGGARCVLRNFCDFVVIVLLQTRCVSSSLFFLCFGLAFCFKGNSIRLLCGNVFRSMSILTLSNSFYMFCWGYIRCRLFLLLLFYLWWVILCGVEVGVFLSLVSMVFG